MTAFFDGEPLAELLDKRRVQLARDVGIDLQQGRLVLSDDDLVRELSVKYSFEPPRITGTRPWKIDLIEATASSPTATGSRLREALQATISLTLEGDLSLLGYRPVRRYKRRFEADLDGDVLTFRVAVVRGALTEAAQAEQIQARGNAELDEWTGQIGWLAEMLANHNDQVDGFLRAALAKRRQRESGLDAVRAAMSVELAPKDAPEVIRVALEKRPTPLAVATTTPGQVVLDDSSFELLLGRLRIMSDVIDQAPAAFREMEEEHLRWFLVAILNSLFGFEGRVAGEAFRVRGKTDIQILWELGAIFVAECKKYDGPKVVADAIDQLDTYLTRRDTKAALLLFVPRKRFSAAMKEALKAVAAHELCDEALDAPDNEGRFEFHLRDDPDAKFHLAVLGFWLRDPPAETPVATTAEKGAAHSSAVSVAGGSEAKQPSPPGSSGRDRSVLEG